MADLSADDRGQLLLVTGFAIAVAIVALVLLLNTAIYTENLATRNVDTDGENALAYRDVVEDELWPAVRDANEDDSLSRDERVRAVDERADQVAGLAARRHRLASAASRVDNRTYHNGTRLTQTDGSRDIRADTGDWNWTMAQGTGDIRNFELNVTGGLESSTTHTDGFRVAVTGNAGDQWRVYVYNNTVTGNVTVAVENGTDPVNDGICSGQISGPPELNLTGGTINGADCPALSFGAGIDEPYDEMTVTFGNRSTGTYNVTVNTTLSPPADGNFNDGPPTSPYEVPVVYSMSADVVYESSTLEYRARVHAGPEEDE